MINLANQITELKELQAESQSKFEYLFNIETNYEKKVLLFFFLSEKRTIDEIIQGTNLSKEIVEKIIEKLEDQETIERVKSGVYELTL